MKKSLKMSVAYLLVALMLASVFPYIASAEEPEYIAVKIGEGGKWDQLGVSATEPGNIHSIGNNPVYVWDASTYTESNTTRGKEYRFPMKEEPVPFTYEFNIYADGNAIAWMTIGGGYPFMYWDVDGTFYTRGTDGKYKASEKQYERGQWHHIGITFRSGNRYCFWIDDEFLGGSDFINPSTYDRIGFSLMAGSYGGRAAYTDIYKYYDTYAVATDIAASNHDRTNHSVTLPGTEEVLIDSENKSVVFKDSVTDFDTFKSAITESAENVLDVKFYSDDYKTETKNLSDIKNMLVKSTGDVYYYYTVEKEALKIKSFEFIESESSVGATSVFSNTTTSDKSLVMILVLKDTDGIIEKIAASAETVIASGEQDIEVSIEPVESEGLTPEVFFIESWSSRLRLFDEIYKK